MDVFQGYEGTSVDIASFSAEAGGESYSNVASPESQGGGTELTGEQGEGNRSDYFCNFSWLFLCFSFELCFLRIEKVTKYTKNWVEKISNLENAIFLKMSGKFVVPFPLLWPLLLFVIVLFVLAIIFEIYWLPLYFGIKSSFIFYLSNFKILIFKTTFYL